jgi:NADPH-dependent 2,4-dienoyl-CoA reductase/sulfur reductase-like enzyme
MPERLVVIGGDAAGLSAATNARRSRTADDLEITVFERGEWISFSACGEPYYVSGEVLPFEKLLIRAPEDFRRANIEINRWHEVTAIDLEARTVTVRDREAARDLVEPFDYLMYATGATPRMPAIPGVDLPGVHTMHVLDDALTVRRLVEEARPERIAIVGGGYVGFEMADAFHTLSIPTTIVTRGVGLLGSSLGTELSPLLTEQVRERGIKVISGAEADAIENCEGHACAVRAGDARVPADLVLLAVGVTPNVELARRAGLRIGASGGVWVDDHLRTSAPGVYAGGDCAEMVHRISGRDVNFHLGTVANKHGRIAGLNIGGGDHRFPGVLGTAITKLADLEVSRTGLTVAEASAAGFDALGTTFDTTTTAGYWPASTQMTVGVVVDRASRRLLGAQIVGGSTAAKRIDALAMALWTEMTVDELVNVDLSYAPPFSAVWDPVLVAARKAQSALDAPT